MCKTIVIGNMGVGKTSLVRRFVNNSFQNDYKATIGVDFEVQQFRILNTNFNMQIWDTAGAGNFPQKILSLFMRF
jgi:small GTP-binding protein